jgi:hypothetical protein
MRFLGSGIVCVVILTFNLIIEIEPNRKKCLCVQKWNESLPSHEFCGKELGKGCEPNVIYNCTKSGAPAIYGYLCSKREGYHRPSCSPPSNDSCDYATDLPLCMSERSCMSEQAARIEYVNTYGKDWQKVLPS